MVSCIIVPNKMGFILVEIMLDLATAWIEDGKKTKSVD